MNTIRQRRHSLTRTLMLGAFAFLTLLLSAALPVRAQEKARAAGEFIDSMGIVNADPYLTPLLGIKHVRNATLSGVPLSLNFNLYQSNGDQFLCSCINYYNKGVNDDLGSAYYLGAALEYVDGPNEPDGNPGQVQYNNEDGVPAAIAWQMAFYPVFKADSKVRGIPILSFPYANPYNAIGSLPTSPYDIISLHDYYGSGIPARDTDGNIGAVDQTAGTGSITKPIMVTEWGYATNTSDRDPCTEKAQAKNIPRGFCEYFLRGVRRDYYFDLFDEDLPYGLTRPDSTQPNGYYIKPSFTAVQNLVSTLTDPGSSFAPGWLDYTLSGGAPGSLSPYSTLNNIHHVLLQKSNGDFYLLIWNHVQVTGSVTSNTQVAPDVTNPPVPVVLNFKTPISNATIFTQQETGGTYARQDFASLNGNSLAVSVTDGMVIVRLTPAQGLAGTQAGPPSTTQVLALQCGGGSNGSFKDDAGYYYTYTNPGGTDAGGTAEPQINGGSYNSNAAINTGKVANPAPSGVYASERWGITTYNLPGLFTGQRVPYTVRLHFAENSGFNAPGQRKFDAYLNGYKVLNDFDIFATTGGSNIATVQQFTAFANSDGKIIPQFLPHSVENPKIDGIELLGDNTQFFADDLNDFSKVYSRTPNWTIDTFNPPNDHRHNGDPARATRTSDTTESLVYSQPGMKTFTAQVQWYQGADLNKINFFSSPDGINWTPLLTTSQVGVGTSDWSWNYGNFTSPCGLPAGTNYLKVEFDQGADTNYDSYAGASGPELAWMNITYAPSATAELAYNGPHALPGTVQAEDYDTGGAGVGYHVTSPPTGSQTGYRPDNNGDIHSGAGPGGNGYAVGWSLAGDWYKYTVSVQNAGSYTAAFQVASQGPGGLFHLEDETGRNLTGSLTAPNTNGWGNWQTVTSPAFTLGAGTHVLRLVEDANGSGSDAWICDFDWFSVSPASVVAWFQADAISGVSSGSALSIWADTSGGNLNATTPSGSNAPTYVAGAMNGKPVVRFSAGSNQMLSFTRPIQDDFTVLCVYQSTQGLGTMTPFYTGAGLVQAEMPGVTNDFGLSLNANGQVLAGVGNPDTSIASANGFNNGSPHLATWKRVRSTGVITLYIDGIQVASGTGGTQSLTAPSQIGLGATVGGFNYLSGDIAEVKVFQTALSDTDRQTQEAALIAKWLSGGVKNAPVILSPTADAYTRDGTYAAINYGTVSPLYVKVSTSSFNRLAYFKFDLTNVTKAVKTATLRVNDSLTGADSLSIGCYGVPTTTWTETGLTWNNQPALGALLSSATVNSTTAGWTTWDASAYVNANLGKVVTLALKSAGTTTAGAAWSGSSREASTNTPQLVVGP